MKDNTENGSGNSYTLKDLATFLFTSMVTAFWFNSIVLRDKITIPKDSISKPLPVPPEKNGRGWKWEEMLIHSLYTSFFGSHCSFKNHIKSMSIGFVQQYHWNSTSIFTPNTIAIDQT